MSNDIVFDDIEFDEPVIEDEEFEVEFVFDVNKYNETPILGTVYIETFEKMKAVAHGISSFNTLKELLDSKRIDMNDVRDMFVVSPNYYYNRYVDRKDPVILHAEAFASMLKDKSVKLNDIFNESRFEFVFSQWLYHWFPKSAIHVPQLNEICALMISRGMDNTYIEIIKKRINALETGGIMFVRDIKCGKDVMSYYRYNLPMHIREDTLPILHARLVDIKGFIKEVRSDRALLKALQYTMVEIIETASRCEHFYVCHHMKLTVPENQIHRHFDYVDHFVLHWNADGSLQKDSFKQSQASAENLRILLDKIMHDPQCAALHERTTKIIRIINIRLTYLERLCEFNEKCPSKTYKKYIEPFVLHRKGFGVVAKIINVYAAICHNIDLLAVTDADIDQMRTRMYIVRANFESILGYTKEQRNQYFGMDVHSICLFIENISNYLTNLSISDEDGISKDISLSILLPFAQTVLTRTTDYNESLSIMRDQEVNVRDVFDGRPENLCLDFTLYNMHNIFYLRMNMEMKELFARLIKTEKSGVGAFINANFKKEDMRHIAIEGQNKSVSQNLTLFLSAYCYRYISIFFDIAVKSCKPLNGSVSYAIDREVADCVNELCERFHWGNYIRHPTCDCSISKAFDSLKANPWKLLTELRLETSKIPRIHIAIDNVDIIKQRCSDNDACQTCRDMVVILLYAIYFIEN